MLRQGVTIHPLSVSERNALKLRTAAPRRHFANPSKGDNTTLQNATSCYNHSIPSPQKSQHFPDFSHHNQATPPKPCNNAAAPHVPSRLAPPAQIAPTSNPPESSFVLTKRI